MRTVLLIVIFGISWHINAQIPIETFAGHTRTTVDIMFFKYFKNKKGENSPWLFFNRNRAGIDYRITESTHLPQFGFTEAISYNHKNFKGFAPVLVAQILSWGIYSKAGIQYAHISHQTTIFTWLVTETKENPDIDYFLLFRYTPKLSKHFKLFTQVESLSTFPSKSKQVLSFVQRLRLGLQFKSFQFGTGADFSQTGRDTYTHTYNLGAFIRHEF